MRSRRRLFAASETRGTTPAAGEHVRERVARELAGHRENYDGPDWYDYEVADRIIALLRASHGEGEAGTWGDTPFAAFVVWWQGRLGAAWVNPRVWCYTRADKAREAARRLKENGVPVALAVAPAARRDGVQGEVWREVDDLLARLERFEYDAAGESEEYWRVVAMRDRIAALAAQAERAVPAQDAGR